MDTKTSNAASSHTSTASNTHAVALRRRHDLIAERRIVRGKVCWYIKDPWTLRHYEIRDEEYQLLCMLNGDASYEQIRRQFEERFAPARLHRGRFAWLVGRFHRDGLVIADGLDQGNVLWQRRQSAESTERQQRWLNPWPYVGVASIQINGLHNCMVLWPGFIGLPTNGRMACFSSSLCYGFCSMPMSSPANFQAVWHGFLFLSGCSSRRLSHLSKSSTSSAMV